MNGSVMPWRDQLQIDRHVDRGLTPNRIASSEAANRENMSAGIAQQRADHDKGEQRDSTRYRMS
jgi:hypothetical protein